MLGGLGLGRRNNSVKRMVKESNKVSEKNGDRTRSNRFRGLMMKWEMPRQMDDNDERKAPTARDWETDYADAGEKTRQNASTWGIHE